MDDRLHGERGWRCQPKSHDLLTHHPRVGRDLELARSLSLTLHQFDRLPASERDLWIAEWEISREKCDCGNLVKDCSDQQRPWYPQMSVCYATMERSAAQARWESLHEERPYHDGTHQSWAKEMSPEHPYYRDAGVNIWVAQRDINPDDDFLGGSMSEDEDPGAGGNQPGA